MVRYLRIAVTLLSLTVCLLLIALWVRSYWQEDIIGYVNSQNRGWHFVSRQGGITLSTANYDPANPGAWRKYVAWEPGLFGFHAFSTGRSSSIRLPSWFPVILFAVLAAATWFRWRFSLRALLIAMALIAVVLGVIAV